MNEWFLTGFYFGCGMTCGMILTGALYQLGAWALERHKSEWRAGWDS